MLRYLLHRGLDKFEKDWGYDPTYMREMLDVGGPWALIRFQLVASLGHMAGAPGPAMAAAGIVGTMAEDCGPCTQISVDIATKSGVAPAVLRGILAGDLDAMGETAALGYHFAHAVLDRRLVEAEELRDEIASRWGKKAVLALSLALTTARMYPTLKYGLGYGKTCSRVVVAGEPAPLKLAA